MAANTVEDRDALRVEPEELVAGGPIVQVEGVEEDKPSEGQDGKPSGGKPEEQDVQPSQDSGWKQPTTHEGETVKTTYSVEDEASIKEKVKGKLISVGDKLRPKDATQVKNADPHPTLV